MPFDVEAIDVSESEGEQDAVASIDGDDESESSGSEEGDDDGFSISDKDDSDSDDQEDSGVESPLSTYDPIPAASLLSSSAPSPSMMTGRLGVSAIPATELYDMQSIWSSPCFFFLFSPLLTRLQYFFSCA
jgi:hypothetical protein